MQWRADPGSEEVVARRRARKSAYFAGEYPAVVKPPLAKSKPAEVSPALYPQVVKIPRRQHPPGYYPEQRGR